MKTLVCIAQLRAARGLLGWSKSKLAEAAGLPLRSVKQYEAEDDVRHVPQMAVEAMRKALEAAGVEFLNGGQPGVRLRGVIGTVPIDALNASNDE